MRAEKMRILTLNMNMFNMQIDDSFNHFLNKYAPDVAIIQECRFTKISKIDNYSIINPNQYELEKIIDGRYYITVAFCKGKTWKRIKEDNSTKYGYRYVKIQAMSQSEKNNWSILGVHIPAEKTENKEELTEFISVIKNSNCDIICGDFNASLTNTESENWKMLEEMTRQSQSKYSDLWEQGLEKDKAFYIDYEGTEQRATKDTPVYRTFVANRHIDYILGKGIKLDKITIDMRTLAFTDHCAIIVDC